MQISIDDGSLITADGVCYLASCERTYARVLAYRCALIADSFYAFAQLLGGIEGCIHKAVLELGHSGGVAALSLHSLRVGPDATPEALLKHPDTANVAKFGGNIVEIAIRADSRLSGRCRELHF